MNKPTTRYVHHDVDVETFVETKGHHREYCLCHNGCKYFKPDNFVANCNVAQTLFEFNVKTGLTTPVIECPYYEQ